jgi:hypothetical protein
MLALRYPRSLILLHTLQNATAAVKDLAEGVDTFFLLFA